MLLTIFTSDKMAAKLEEFFNDISSKKQEQVRRWISKNRPDPEVMFLNDDVSTSCFLGSLPQLEVASNVNSSTAHLTDISC